MPCEPDHNGILCIKRGLHSIDILMENILLVYMLFVFLNIAKSVKSFYNLALTVEGALACTARGEK